MSAVETDRLVEPHAVRMPPCEFCRHDWHGLPCRSIWGHSTATSPAWPSLRGHPCDCPSSYVEPPC